MSKLGHGYKKKLKIEIERQKTEELEITKIQWKLFYMHHIVAQ